MWSVGDELLTVTYCGFVLCGQWVMNCLLSPTVDFILWSSTVDYVLWSGDVELFTVSVTYCGVVLWSDDDELLTVPCGFVLWPPNVAPAGRPEDF